MLVYCGLSSQFLARAEKDPKRLWIAMSHAAAAKVEELYLGPQPFVFVGSPRLPHYEEASYSSVFRDLGPYNEASLLQHSLDHEVTANVTRDISFRYSMATDLDRRLCCCCVVQDTLESMDKALAGTVVAALQRHSRFTLESDLRIIAHRFCLCAQVCGTGGDNSSTSRRYR